MSQAPLGRRDRIDRSRARAWALQVHYRWEAGGREISLPDALVETVATRRISPGAFRTSAGSSPCSTSTCRRWTTRW